MGTLYIVSTPIGNLDDITLRAIKTLNEVHIIVSEDIPKTRQLLSELKKRYPDMFDLNKNQTFIQANEFEEENVTPRIIQLLEEENIIAFVSEAGTPLISDPGFQLVRKAVKHTIPITSIPGASAPITALSISGLPTNAFYFFGFPPKSKGKKETMFMNLKQILDQIPSSLHPTVIFFESPHRLLETLHNIQTVFGNIQIVITRELTKKFEEVRRESVEESIKHFENKPPKGEFTILFNLK